MKKNIQFLFFAFGLTVILLLMVRPAFASGTIVIPASIPATPWFKYGTSGNYVGSTVQTACQLILNVYGDRTYHNKTVNGDPALNNWNCYYHTNAAPTTAVLFGTILSAYTCPSGRGTGGFPSGSAGCVITNAALIEPNSNASGTNQNATCNTGYVPNAGANGCIVYVPPPVACPAAGTLYAKGFFNVGTTFNGRLLNTACVASCGIELINGYVPAASSIINGVKYYFGQATYNHTGAACSPDTPNFLSDFVGSLPSATCGAGQQMIAMAGVTKCFDSVGSEVITDSASAVSAAQTLADQAKAKKIADAAAAASAAGLSASSVEAAQSMAAGVGGVSISNNPYPPGDPLNAFCVDNPTADLCQQKTACDKNPNLASCAELGTVADDVPLGTRTVYVSAITPVTVGGAGACPAPRAMVLHGQTYYMSFETYCNYANGIRPIILAFAWLTAAGLLVGGFKAS